MITDKRIRGQHRSMGRLRGYTRFRFLPVPPPPIDIPTLVARFVEASKRINEARDELRRTVGEMAGGNVDEWSFEECLRYADGLVARYQTRLLEQLLTPVGIGEDK